MSFLLKRDDIADDADYEGGFVRRGYVDGLHLVRDDVDDGCSVKRDDVDGGLACSPACMAAMRVNLSLGFPRFCMVASTAAELLLQRPVHMSTSREMIVKSEVERGQLMISYLVAVR